MRKKIFTFLLALAASVGMSWATPAVAVNGKLPGAFSVSDTKVVYFSQGNLQATTNDLGETWTWGFAENQWDYVGNAAANTSFDYWGGKGNGSYDLFGWIGESSALTDYRQYGIGSNYDFTDCGNTPGENLKADWGSLMGSDWRTLTYDEWQYLIKSRNNAANLLAYATVNGKTGLILLPDSWASSSVALTITTANYTTNIISASDWSTLEEQGCVFLPAAGWRSDDSVSGVGEGGDYWSSSSPSGKQYDEGSAYCFFFDTDFSKQADGMHFNRRGRGYGLSVRLVSETAPSGGSAQAGLQVIELQVPGSWEGDNTLVTVSDLPGFVVFTLEEAGAWDAPDGNVNLIYMSKNNEGVRATSFFDGVWGQEYVAGFTRSVVFGWASNGNRIFYTTDGSEPTPTTSDWVLDGDVWDADTKTLTINRQNVGNVNYITRSEIEHVIISSSVETIGNEICGGCENLIDVTIGANVTSIGTEAFPGCNSLTTVTCEAVTPPSIGADPFNLSSNLAHIYVPAESVTAYKEATNWSSKASIISAAGGGSTPAGLQVTELQIPASWQNDNTLVTISDLPGFVAVSLEEAEPWDAAPEGNAILIYAGTNEGVTALEFNNRVLNDFGPFGGFTRADIFDWGYKIFYTSGGSTPTPAVDPAVQNVIDLINAIPNQVAYNDECKNAIDAARAAYDALTDAQKTLVENYGALLDAETAYAQLAPNPSGECGAQGDNLLWELNTSTGVLTITGSGAMYDWAYDTDLPWYDNRLQITSVVLPSGITSLGTKAFRGCQNLASINMTENYPAGLTVINQEAFCHTKLTSVIIPESVVTIGQDAFYRSENITDVYCYADPNNLTWTDFWCDDFTSAKSTQCHVKDCYLEVYNSKWNTNSSSTDVNVTFVGDLPGDCGAPTPTPSGDKLPGAFTVDNTGKQVNFSKGNVQYVGGSWKFADNQWDMIGNAQANDNRDLFGWGTGSEPNKTTEYEPYYTTFTDWGTNFGEGWRTLTKDEWIYLLETRDNAANLRTLATVNSVKGLILMPDGWTASGVALAVTIVNYTSNMINESNWATLASQGCVFLPAAGYRVGDEVSGVGSEGYYFSSTNHSDNHAAHMSFETNTVTGDQYTFAYCGNSVRLVTDAGGSTPTPTPTDEQVPTNVDPENPSYHYSTFFHSTQNYKLTNDGTEAFIADLSNNDLVLTKIAEGAQVIPANTAVILRKTGSADPVVLNPTEENGVSVNPDDNDLEGVDAVTPVTSIDGLTMANCYVLSGTDQYGVGFYRINSENLKAHKAYVKYAGLQNNAPKRMRFVFNQEQTATGIDNTNAVVESQKILENGVLYIIRDGVRYNAQGQLIK